MVFNDSRRLLYEIAIFSKPETVCNRLLAVVLTVVTVLAQQLKIVEIQ